MNSFSRILVALDNSPMDQYLIRHARRVADLFEASRVYFVFILPSLALPKSAQAAFREQFEPDVPIDEQVRAALEKEILENWGAERATEWSLDVIEGKPFSQLLHWLDVKKIELLVVGQKLASTGSGITARKLASHARCNVLFVPEMPLNDGMRLLAPVDFSKDSARALKMALTWKSTHPAAGIVALHVTDLLATG